VPRRRPPVEIYTTPVPDSLTETQANCPVCGGSGQPYGFVVEKLVFRCRDCGVRFKAQPGRQVSAWARGEERP